MTTSTKRRAILLGVSMAAVPVVAAACGSSSSDVTATSSSTSTSAHSVATATTSRPPSTGDAGSNTGAPTGRVVHVGSDTFTIDVSGTDVTVDTVAGSTYQITSASEVSSARVGQYVAAMGTGAGDVLQATSLAFVPDPPSFIASWAVTSTPQGTVYFGRITSIGKGTITITTGDGPRTISTAAVDSVTRTAATTFKAIAVGETVEVNGPKSKGLTYTGHQINIGETPAVVGQFD